MRDCWRWCHPQINGNLGSDVICLRGEGGSLVATADFFPDVIRITKWRLQQFPFGERFTYVTHHFKPSSIGWLLESWKRGGYSRLPKHFSSVLSQNQTLGLWWRGQIFRQPCMRHLFGRPAARCTPLKPFQVFPQRRDHLRRPSSYTPDGYIVEILGSRQEIWGWRERPRGNE